MKLSEELENNHDPACDWVPEIKQLEVELMAVLDVAIARGEQLGYEDIDYRERLEEMDDE